MTNITFSIAGRTNGSVTVPCQIIYEGTEYTSSRINQVTQRTLDGKLVTYDNGIDIVSGTIQMNAVSKAVGVELRRWLRQEAVFAFRRFTISAVAGIDLGNGDNTQLLLVTFPNSNDNGVFKFVAPGMWKISFPYEYVR